MAAYECHNQRFYLSYPVINPVQLTIAYKRFMAKRNDSICPVPAGTLVIIGGKENKGENSPENKEKPDDFIRLEVLQKFVDLIGKKNAVLEVITTSTGSPEESFEEYRKVFTELGLSAIGHIHHSDRKSALQPEILERVSKADAFFFTGGDQLKLTSIYGGTPFLTELKQRYINEPITVGGTSAGAMALSTPMIYAGNEEVQELGGEIKVTTGLEFLKDVCIDTHFVHRGRFVRMAQVVVTNPTCIGIGIEEDTALIVRNGLDVEIIGTGTVIIIEGFEIEEGNVDDFTSKKPVTIRNLRVHMLASGNHYQIRQINPPHI
ncbi:cyanophycinase [Segetibacter sp. 3557_3]|uniref:cyanophycinase n=1 Tax=Segetibacter sp. 3557_3 TaxID=2547429 RepID=UPI0010588D9D|nr:cyanophycinase [Segetibacter sp. 3557_3]TDH21560.1 cyanophycinase [Segetibacter sp. 3557_3]